MSNGKMHDDEVDIDSSLVRRLLAAQFPQWADLPVELVRSAGTDNAMYRLGDTLAVRLPRTPGAAHQVSKEYRWLPKLAPLLPLAIPTPLALGEPGEGYPFQWSVCVWLPGATATDHPPADLDEAARQMAGFLLALQRIDTAGAPTRGPNDSDRGAPLAPRDDEVREAIAVLGDMIDGRAAMAEWEIALQAPEWSGPPVWMHGDLLSSNLLIDEGRLSAVIDFGCLGVGDPACEMLFAWNLLSAPARETFRATLGVDAATWARGRGWALSVGLIALPYYQRTNPTLANIARRLITEVLADQ